MEENDRSRLINNSDTASQESFFEGIIRPCMAEFVATAFFVFIGTMSIPNAPLIAIAIAHGFTIAVMVAGGGPISGGHVNPAVTLAVFLVGGMSAVKAVLYFIAQIIGSILGAALTRGCLSESVYKTFMGGGLTIGDHTTVGQGLLCEIVTTSLLVTVILLCAVDEGTRVTFHAIPIGFTVVACILAGGTISGASMNPARGFGPAVVVSTYRSDVWDYHWIYWVGPALGTLIAVINYRLFLASGSKRILAPGSS